MISRQEPLTESYFYILLCLLDKPKHGYGIMQEAEKLSKNQVKIGSGTMYGATGNMMKKGWIKEIECEEEGANRKRMYQLTPLGREILMTEIVRLRTMIEAADLVNGEEI